MAAERRALATLFVLLLALYVAQIDHGLPNRDVVEANQSLLDAQNALIRLKVQHFVARLNLLKDMGLFFVDDRGMWR